PSDDPADRRGLRTFGRTGYHTTARPKESLRLAAVSSQKGQGSLTLPAGKMRCLVSIREHIESLESFVIQEWWPDSRRVTYVECRKQDEREASPTAAIIDSQSVKSAEKGGPGSIRMAMMRARRSRARSATFS